MIPYTPDAYQLLQEGAVAFARVSGNGMRVDVKYLDNAIVETESLIKTMEKDLGESKVYRKWRKRFGTKTNYTSNDQLGVVLFEEMKLKCPERTKTGKYGTGEEVLVKVDHPFVKRYIDIRKKRKGVQFLKALLREVCDGKIHPVFNLNTVATYRSSCDSPNFQNMPVRDEWMKNLVRRCIVARKGRRIVEIDFKGVEVAGAACYHKDPNMLEYIEDKSKDMHRDMAMECYLLKQDQVTKQIRHAAKNKFVFPQFYGDWWLSCAEAMWESCSINSLVTTDGTPLLKHLRRKGIKELGDALPCNADSVQEGTFQDHIKQVERKFWHKKFPTYTQWKKDWYAEYLKQGWFKTLTGFICQGFMDRKQVINYPIQGVSFHCLLQSFIWLVNTELKKHHMKAIVIGQVHDSIVADVPDEEVDDFVELCLYLTTVKLREHWDWIICSLEVEVEITPTNGSWVEKEPRKVG